MAAECNANIFRFHVELEAIVATIAPYATGFHAAKRLRQVPVILGIDPDHTGIDVSCVPVASTYVIGPDVRGETVVDVLGNPKGLFFVL